MPTHPPFALPGMVGALTGQTVAVTGPGGFIGAAVCLQALAAGARVVALGPGAPVHTAVQHSPARIETEEDLTPHLMGVDVLVHAAGRGAPGAIRALHDDIARSDLHVTAVVLEAAARAGVGRVVLLSSGGTVYGDADGHDPITETHRLHPMSRYGAVRLQAEEMARAMDRMGLVHCVIARLSNPYGPGQVNRRGQGLVATIAHRVRAGLPIEVWGDGSTVRDYVFIDDAASGLLAAARLPGGAAVNVSSGAGITTRQVIEDVLACLGSDAAIRYLPEKDAGVACNILCSEKLRRETGWRPATAWAEGLARTAAWWGASPVRVPELALSGVAEPV